MVFRMRRASSTLLSVFVFICIVFYFLNICGITKAQGSPRIAVACLSTFEPSFGYKSLSNKLRYADKHGYHLEFDFKGSGYWNKIDIVQRLVRQRKYNWIWWIDFDALITNMTVRLEDLIEESLATAPYPNKIDMILNRDCTNFNAGSMLFRSNARVSAFLTEALDCRDKPLNGKDKPTEQDCFNHIIEENKRGEKERVLFVPQWKMNAYPEEIPCADKTKRKWEHGMFVIHFAGAWIYMPNSTDAKKELFDRYHWRIIY